MPSIKEIMGWKTLKPYDFNKPILKLSEIKTRAKLYRAGVKQ
jgi:hypothetical protein